MRGWLLMAFGGIVAGCSREPVSGAAVTRDSSGIRIVENAGPAWRAGAGWTVSDTPLVDIGGKSGDPAYELDQVRGPIRLQDGRIVLANAATSEIRFYDGTGKHLRSVGRKGTGPGEFQSIASLWPGAGDSLLVGDALLRRITVLDHDGNFGRLLTLGNQEGALAPIGGRVELAIPLGLFSDGSIAGMLQAIMINQPREGVYRDSVTLLHYGPDGSLRDTLGRLPGAEMSQLSLTVQGRAFSAPTPVPLGKQTMIALSGDRLYVAQNNAWEIEIRDARGALRTLGRAPRQPVKLTPSDITAHRKEQREAMEAQPMFRNIPEPIKTQLLSQFDQVKYPATLAFFGPLFPDPSGSVWAQEAASPSGKVIRFAIMDSTGRWLGTVKLPESFRMSFVAGDAVYGVWKDADEVEHARGYRLSKP